MANNVLLAEHVSILAVAHTSESMERVEAAVRVVAGGGAKPLEVKVERLRGHFKNPIHTLSASINKQKAAFAFFERILKLLSPQDLAVLADSLDQKFDDEKTTLFLRFDKQKAFKDGLLVLCTRDGTGGSISTSIRFSKFPPTKASDIKLALRKKVMEARIVNLGG